MFRLAHISDLHLSPLPQIKWHQLVNKRITGYLNWKLNRKHQIGSNTLIPLIDHLHATKTDHIAVTGDLVNLALEDEFENARTFLDGLGVPEDVSVILGNHDAYVPGALNKAMKAWEPFCANDNKSPLKISQFPYLRKRNNVALIGCNSAEATLPLFATGAFGKEQALNLAKTLRKTQGMCRVVMIHHPPIEGATRWHKRLKGIQLFQDVITEEGAELVLHGHTHLATRNEIAGKQKPVPVICVPAAGNGLGDHRPAGRYNLFEISKDHDVWRINWKAYGMNETNGSIIELENTIL